jgi:hypothetical protein
MLLAFLFLLVVLEDEDVVVRHNSFAEPGQGQNHSPLVVVAVVVAAVAVVVAAVAVVVAAVAVVVAAVAVVVAAVAVVVAAVAVVVAVEIHEQRNCLRQGYTFLLGLHWHSSGPFVHVYYEESLD